MIINPLKIISVNNFEKSIKADQDCRMFLTIDEAVDKTCDTSTATECIMNIVIISLDNISIYHLLTVRICMPETLGGASSFESDQDRIRA